MKSFNMFKMPVILLGFGGALLLSPACKAQEVTSDHFTDTGVQDVYEPGAGKVVTATVAQKPLALKVQKHQIGSTTTLQLTTKRGSSLPAQPGAQVVAEKRKASPVEVKKP